MATREQAAVLIDRFLNRKDSILADHEASLLLNQAKTKLVNGDAISHSNNMQIDYRLWNPYAKLPGQFGINAISSEEIVWSGQFHAVSSVEAVNLPQENYPPYRLEQYLVDGSVYEYAENGTVVSGWLRYPSLTPDEVAEVKEGLKQSLLTSVEPGTDLHRSGKCTVTNTAGGYRVAYTGEISDPAHYLISYFFDEDLGSDPVTDSCIKLMNSATYTRTYDYSKDGTLLACDTTIHVDCRQSADPNDYPVKSYDEATSIKFDYGGVNITLPTEAIGAELVEG